MTTQHPRAPGARQARPAVGTRHTAATTAANKVRHYLVNFSSLSLKIKGRTRAMAVL